MSESVAAAAMAIAAAPATDDGMTEESFSATTALVAFLRMEADIAEEKAKRLRQQATSLAQQFCVSEALQDAYELDPDQMPPLDEHGVPKYKGKKRGRKPKLRKRKANPNRRKRQHTGYTFYIQEVYPGIKAQHPNLPSKDIIGMVAKQWKGELTEQEKVEWKERAIATHEDATANAVGADDDEAAAAAAVEDVEEEEDEEEEDDVEMVEADDPSPPARRKRRQKKAGGAVV